MRKSGRRQSIAWPLSAALIFFALPAAIFLQATLLANTLPGEVTPNLGFFLTAAAGYLWGAAGGAAAGMWGGALLGAAAGSLAAPVACVYGIVGWLAGCHAERKPARWTLPLVAASLAILTVCGENFFQHVQPSLSWQLWNIAWMACSGLSFLGISTEKPTS